MIGYKLLSEGTRCDSAADAAAKESWETAFNFAIAEQSERGLTVAFGASMLMPLTAER